MEKIGQVVKNNGSTAKVQVLRASACGEKCASCKGGCETTSLYVDAQNIVSACPGQMVKIEMETKTIMKAAALAYIFPLIMLIVGIFVGYKIIPIFSLSFSVDFFAFLVGLIFMAISYFVVGRIYSQKHTKKNMEYKITKIF